MIAPRYVQQELRLIDKSYFAVFNPYVYEKTHMSFGKARWQVRKWIGKPKRPNQWNRSNSETLFTICKEMFDDRGLYDAGYKSIDIRAVQEIRESNWWKLKWKDEVAKIDHNNETLERRANQRLKDESKMAAKAIWRHYHEPFCDYGRRDKY